MLVRRHLQTQFAVLFSAVLLMGVSQNSIAQSFTELDSQLAALDVKGEGIGYDRTSEDHAGQRQEVDSSASFVLAGVGKVQRPPTEAVARRFRSLRTRIRFDRSDSLKRHLAELSQLGVDTSPSQFERFEASLYEMQLSELKSLFDQRKVAITDAKKSEDFTSLRELGVVGYHYGWNLRYSRLMDNFADLENALDAAFAPYLESPPPQLTLPLARYFRFKAQSAFSRGNKSENSRFAMLERKMLVRNEIYPPDFVLLTRLKARSLQEDPDAPPGFRPEPCKLLEQLLAIRPDDKFVVRGYVDCQINLAADQAKNDTLLAIATLDVTREYLLMTQNSYPQISIDAGIYEIKLLNALSEREQNLSLTMDSESYKYLAFGRFIDVLKGHTYRPNFESEIFELYNFFKEIDSKSLPETLPSGERYRDSLDLLLGIADSVEQSRAADPGSPAFSVVFADSLARAAQLMLDRANREGADTASKRAESAIDEARLISSLSEVDERASSECLVRNRRVRVLIELERTDEALTAFRKFDASCGDWVRKYPWDFYARQYVTDINNRLGNYLNSKGRFAEALPLLTYASNWGVKSSTTTLAGIYADPAGAFVDPGKAKGLEELAERQSLKRFTVPTEFSGTKYPVHVYVAEYGPGTLCKFQAEPLDPAEACVGYEGIDDQVIWLDVLRDGKVPPDVVDSFRKLFRIARENNVSLPDLAAYALGAASKPQIAATDAQVTAIYDEMNAKKFARSPDRWLDPAGIALGGHDAVSYRQGSAPVLGSAEFYTLWDGALWLFKDAANRDLFNSDPERFAPQYGGFSAWEVIDRAANAGEPAIFAVVDDKLFMFDAEKHVADWKADAASKIAKADEAWLGMEPAVTATATSLADRILKLGPVGLADRAALYVEGCQQDRGDQCVRLFRVARTQCFQNDSIPACNLAIAFAEGMEDKSLLVSLLGGRSWKYAQVNKPDEAIADAERALAIDPDQPWIHGNLANGLLIKGQVERAIAIYREQKDRPGPGQEGTMCKFILEDIDTMLAAKVIGEAAAAEVRRAIVCP